MTDAPTPLKSVAVPPMPPMSSINDNLPTSNPSGRTVLIVLGCAIVLGLGLYLYHSFGS
jgi:hypothetical protein